MPIKRELSGDALTATVRLQARGPLSKADVAELRRETDAWGLEARLRSYEQSARIVLERAGYRTDIPWRSFRSLVADEDSKERLAAWILWRIGLLRQTKADLSDWGAVSIRNTWWEKIALAALDVQELVDELRYGEIHGPDTVAGIQFREAGNERKRRGHPRRPLHDQWRAEIERLVADGRGWWQAAGIVAARHGAKTKTVYDAVRRLRKNLPR